MTRLVGAILSITIVLILGVPRSSSAADAVPFEKLEAGYTKEIRPLLQKYCLNCHSTELQEGQLDLERFKTLGDLRKDSKPWPRVVEMLDNGEMPPKKSKQLTSDERKQLRTWAEQFVHAEAIASAGDPGPVVLRRLGNAEYTYTLKDLTGVDLQPAKEFPADGAAGEGFTNTGNALVMSPALFVKYLDAAKMVASHAVLLPDGFRFSKSTTRRDWTDELLNEIRGTYKKYADEAGKIPLEKYLKATLEEREAIRSGGKSVTKIAQERGLSAPYLATMWQVLNDDRPSLLLNSIRERWKTAKPADAAALSGAIQGWQGRLTRFQPVGHMKTWMVPMNPAVHRPDFRIPLPDQGGNGEVKVTLAVSTAGDGNEHDFMEWQAPQLVVPGRAPIFLQDLRAFTTGLTERRTVLFGETAKSLAVAATITGTAGKPNLPELAKQYGVSEGSLAGWLGYLGIGTDAVIRLNNFTTKMNRVGGYEFVSGWGSGETPLFIANSSDQHVRVPGNMKGHGVCVHPSPSQDVAAGWRSPISGIVKVSGAVMRAHPECGNGVRWALELRRGVTRQKLVNGEATGGASMPVGPVEHLAVQTGDVISLIINARDGSHGCDLTDIDFTVQELEGEKRAWTLTKDVTGDILASNPHADKFGNKETWNFYSEPITGESNSVNVPPGSLLARWLDTNKPDEKAKLAEELQKMLTSQPPADAKHPDAILYRRLCSLTGPLYYMPVDASKSAGGTASPWGLPAEKFGQHANGTRVDQRSLCVQAPEAIEIRLPADLVVGCEFLTTAFLHPQVGTEGSVQPQVAVGTAVAGTSLRDDLPILVHPGSKGDKRIAQEFDEFRQHFPAAVCYPQIVPVDEAVTLTLFHREDDNLRRLLLTPQEGARLERCWQELHFISQDALTQVDSFLQLLEYASQDSDPRLFEPFRKQIYDRAAAYKKELVDAEPSQLKQLYALASQAYRRPLTDSDLKELQTLYQTLRAEPLPHEEAFRFLLARILASPKFLYRLEQPPSGTAAGPVSDWELATRLSYLLWSSAPDEELRQVAASGKLHEPDVLVAQARRMLKDARTRRLATEFACQWLHVYEFDALDEKSERHFPTFNKLRGDMYEEVIRFFTDLFQNDGSVISVLNADHTFVNAPLAAHYGMPEVKGSDWKRVDGVAQYGRGGILGLAATLSKQSGASRTSPILRGNWVSEVLLGEKLPRPPKDVPTLPEDETATAGLTVRQLVEKHSNDARCSNCHQRIDPMGFSLEAYDAIGRLRTKDLADRPINTQAKTLDGSEFEGLAGLRQYLMTKRGDAILRQFCKKFIGYGLGREVQLSDEPLLQEMQQKLKQNDYRFSVAVETLLRSRQFREIRGKDQQFADLP
ncbi:MAG: DUF1592 domain-containing protein [Planctomycetales bacterium]